MKWFPWLDIVVLAITLSLVIALVGLLIKVYG